MSKLKKKIGLAPGSIVFTGNRKVDKVLIHHVQYDSNNLTERVLSNHSKSTLIKSDELLIDWYDVRGMHDTELIGFFGSTFDIHPLILEAVVDINQRPKFEEYAKGNFILLRSLVFDPVKLELKKEHIAIYFNDQFIATFQEDESDLFESVRKRINVDRSRIRTRGADYLAYALIDETVDNYYNALENIELQIETLEETMIENVDHSTKNKIHRLKKELLSLRKSILPLREAIANFYKTESSFVHDDSRIFIRNLYENTVQIMDTLESYRDILNGLQDLFISEVSFKMNKVMQLLTIISVIFIPLTFLAGIYGMNFENIPELKYKYSYFILWGIMVVIFVCMIYFFKKRKWL
ncbi:magnesium/cobalt transporter CorA [Flavivirga sp. 57AJ16]|uniref:magnesium/cobalt transporter CorA n=1 Tax=Flavivirga sp. 57AJ16 TaxID=3025307 RepID=UPI002366FC28|nr:magnesium/cobalt transporter CorA [Flavivirga sp. 57AJ16]MDD7885248.1 magnesium/cobalt transporter CorA [Flavivirga sp. 57AJ16]